MRKKGGSVWKYIARNGARLWRYQFEGDPAREQAAAIQQGGIR